MYVTTRMQKTKDIVHNPISEEALELIGYSPDKRGTGIGALIGFYGLGQTLIGLLPAIKDWWKNRHGNQGTGYNGTPV